jgi:hypothetical protein
LVRQTVLKPSREVASVDVEGLLHIFPHLGTREGLQPEAMVQDTWTQERGYSLKQWYRTPGHKRGFTA